MNKFIRSGKSALLLGVLLVMAFLNVDARAQDTSMTQFSGYVRGIFLYQDDNTNPLSMVSNDDIFYPEVVVGAEVYPFGLAGLYGKGTVRYDSSLNLYEGYVGYYRLVNSVYFGGDLGAKENNWYANNSDLDFISRFNERMIPRTVTGVSGFVNSLKGGVYGSGQLYKDGKRHNVILMAGAKVLVFNLSGLYFSNSNGNNFGAGLSILREKFVAKGEFIKSEFSSDDWILSLYASMNIPKREKLSVVARYQRDELSKLNEILTGFQYKIGPGQLGLYWMGTSQDAGQFQNSLVAMGNLNL